MATRFTDALAIQDGACNPSGIAHALVNACRECIDEGKSQREDPAVRLIVHQLAYICGVSSGIGGFYRDNPTWKEAMEICRQKDTEEALKLQGALENDYATSLLQTYTRGNHHA